LVGEIEDKSTCGYLERMASGLGDSLVERIGPDSAPNMPSAVSGMTKVSKIAFREKPQSFDQA